MSLEMNPAAIPAGLHSVDVELVKTDVGDMWFPLLDRVMRDHIRSAGTWEPDIGNVLREIMPQGDTAVFLDIGANVGYFSRMVAGAFPQATVHAFEPHPLTCQVLRMNAWQFGDRVHVWPVALSDNRGTVALCTSPNNLGDTRGMRGRDSLVASIVSPAISLDELMGNIRVDVVKIDVQGAELAVLQGMKGVLRNSPNIRIVMEFSPGLLRADDIDAVAALGGLRELGFDLNLIRPDALFSASDAEIMAFCHSAGPLGQANLLLAPKS